MRLRPAVPAAGAVFCLMTALSAPAFASLGQQAPAVPGTGDSTTALTLLGLTGGGHDLSLAKVDLLATLLQSAPLAKIGLTPLVADGTAYGSQETTDGASSSPVLSTAAVPGLPAGLFSATAPVLSGTATTTDGSAKTLVGSDSLGGLSLLGLPVDLSGAVSTLSGVDGDGATSTLRMTVDGLRLPSVADLLAALGLDLSALPVGTLTDLISRLGMTVDSTVDGVQAQLTSAGKQLTSALDSADLRKTQLGQATVALAPAQAALSTALAQAPAACAQLPIGSILDNPVCSTLGPVTTQLQTATAAVTSAQNLVDLAQAALDTANRLVDTVQKTVADLTAQLTGLLQDVLDGVPLLSLDQMVVDAKAVSTGEKDGEQQASITGGELTGLTVLGKDVLGGTLSLTDASAGALTQLDGAISQVTGVLGSVLSNVPGFPTLKLTPPAVSVLDRTSLTDVVDGFGVASTGLSLLDITLPSIQLPAGLALPGAASLPAFGALPTSALPTGALPTGALPVGARSTTGLGARASQVEGLMSSAPMQLSIGTLSNASRFKALDQQVQTVTGPVAAPNSPAAPAAAPAVAPTRPVVATLPRTGLQAGLAGLAVVLVGGALVLRRRTTAAEEPDADR